MTKNIWGTTYTLEGNTVHYTNSETSGSFKAFEGIGNSLVDFENVCHAHFVNELN